MSKKNVLKTSKCHKKPYPLMKPSVNYFTAAKAYSHGSREYTLWQPYIKEIGL
jgi:hypothetical protein